MSVRHLLVSVTIVVTCVAVASSVVRVSPVDVRNAHGQQSDALIVLSTDDLDTFHDVLNFIRRGGGNIFLAFIPSAYIGDISPELENMLRQHPAVALVTREAIDPSVVKSLGIQARKSVHIWNELFRGTPEVVVLTTPPPGPPDSPVQYETPEIPSDATPTPIGRSQIGDVDGDGKVDSIDASLLLQFHYGIFTSELEHFVQKGDVNTDGFTDVFDANLILFFHAGMIRSLPVR